MLSLTSKGSDAKVLEPSSGEGVFLESLHRHGFKNYTAYEIDKTILEYKSNTVKKKSFVSEDFNEKYDLIIGNPPYVRWKNMTDSQKKELETSLLWNTYCNSLGDLLYYFIIKSIELLKEDGELIFITPEYWLNTMHSVKMRQYMLRNGYIECIYHFSETPVFNKVASSIIIFKYIKTTHKKNSPQMKVFKYTSQKKLTALDLCNLDANPSWEKFSLNQFSNDTAWTLAKQNIVDELARYERKCHRSPDQIPSNFQRGVSYPYISLGDISNIANGMVSGLDKAFQLPKDLQLTSLEANATIDVIKSKDIESVHPSGYRKYIFLNEHKIDEKTLKQQYPNFYKQLKPYEEQLTARYSYNRKIPYWDWVFLRSYNLFSAKRSKLFVPCKERITNKERLRFALVDEQFFPTQDVTAVYLNEDVKEDIRYINALLNSKITYDWVTAKGLIKGGVAEFSERPLSSIPIKLIDWNNQHEIRLHDEIVQLVKKMRTSKANCSVQGIDGLILKLIRP